GRVRGVPGLALRALGAGRARGSTGRAGRALRSGRPDLLQGVLGLLVEVGDAQRAVLDLLGLHDVLLQVDGLDRLVLDVGRGDEGARDRTSANRPDEQAPGGDDRDPW